MIQIRKSQSLLGTISATCVAIGLLAAPALAGTYAPELNKINSGAQVEALVRYKGTAGTRNPGYAPGSTYVGTAGDSQIWKCTAAAAKTMAPPPTVRHASPNHPLLAP